MIKPLNENVVFKVEDLETATASGLITNINNNDAAATRIGEVVAVAEDADELINVGDRIVVAGMSLAGAQLKIDGEEFYAVKDSVIIGIL